MDLTTEGEPAGTGPAPDGASPADGERPRRCTPHELSKVGVELIDTRSLTLGCTVCGQRWQPMLRTGGRLPRCYWRCPRCRGLG